MKRKLASLFIPLILLTACSANHDINLDVSIAEDVNLSGTTLMVVISSVAPDTPAGASTAAPWGLEGDVAFQPGSEAVVELEAGTYNYQVEGFSCCEQVQTRWIFVFVDENGNGAYDAGEAAGADPGNPVDIGDTYNTAIAVSYL